MQIDNFLSAKERIKNHIRKTPLEFSYPLSKQFSAEIFLKLENWQKTGSFKIRGALNKLLSLSAAEKQQGVITASAGNHGLGVAHAAAMLQVPAKIVVPENASAAKVEALENFDIELIKKGADYDDAEEIAWEIQNREALTFVHAFSDPGIIAGQGTIALEILEQLPDVQTVVVPIGGGGLISGIASVLKATKPDIRVLGVQSTASPAMHNSVKAGKIVETPIKKTIADGLAGRFVTDLTLDMTREFVDKIVLVSEASIKKAIRSLVESEHMLIEGSAAVGISAFFENKVPFSGKCAVVLTGRNITYDLLKTLL